MLNIICAIVVEKVLNIVGAVFLINLCQMTECKHVVIRGARLCVIRLSKFKYIIHLRYRV